MHLSLWTVPNFRTGSPKLSQYAERGPTALGFPIGSEAINVLNVGGRYDQQLPAAQQIATARALHLTAAHGKA